MNWLRNKGAKVCSRRLAECEALSLLVQFERMQRHSGSGVYITANARDDSTSGPCKFTAITVSRLLGREPTLCFIVATDRQQLRFANSSMRRIRSLVRTGATGSRNKSSISSNLSKVESSMINGMAGSNWPLCSVECFVFQLRNVIDEAKVFYVQVDGMPTVYIVRMGTRFRVKQGGSRLS